MKKKISIALILTLIPNLISAQCAMCKAVVESGDAEMAESLNSGIMYLMIFPYLLVGVAGYFIIKKLKKR